MPRLLSLTECSATSLLADWLAESATNIGLSPFYAVAAVLMTLQLSERPRSDRQHYDSRPR